MGVHRLVVIGGSVGRECYECRRSDTYPGMLVLRPRYFWILQSRRLPHPKASTASGWCIEGSGGRTKQRQCSSEERVKEGRRWRQTLVALRQALAHLREASLVLEAGVIAERLLLVVAELLRDRIVRLKEAREVGLGVGNNLAILDVEATDLDEVAGGGVVVGDELSNDRELLGGVDELVRAVVLPVALTVRVEVTTIGVAETSISVGSVALLASAALKASLVGGLARVGSIGSGDGVGFPDVHLGTASAVVALAGVGVVGRSGPSFDIGLAVNELDVPRALRVTVTSTVLSASLVGGVLGHAAALVHLDEVEGSIETPRELGDVDVEGKLLVQNVGHLVLGVTLHEVDTGADVGVLAPGDELEGEGIAAGRDVVGGSSWHLREHTWIRKPGVPEPVHKRRR